MTPRGEKCFLSAHKKLKSDPWEEVLIMKESGGQRNSQNQHQKAGACQGWCAFKQCQAPGPRFSSALNLSLRGAGGAGENRDEDLTPRLKQVEIKLNFLD